MKIQNPQSFPNRSGKKFVTENKNKKQIHKFDEEMAVPQSFETFKSIKSKSTR